MRRLTICDRRSFVAVKTSHGMIAEVFHKTLHKEGYLGGSVCRVRHTSRCALIHINAARAVCETGRFI